MKLFQKELKKIILEKKLFSIGISLGNYQDFIESIIHLARERASSYVCIANVHTCIEAYKDPVFADIVNNAIITTPDDMPIVKSIKYLYSINQVKVSGPDLILILLKEAELHQLKVFLYGSTEVVLQKLNVVCLEKYPF